jgi:hypothetical protein
LNDQHFYICSGSQRYRAHTSTAGLPAVKDLANAKIGEKFSADAAMIETSPKSRENKFFEHLMYCG